MWRVRCLRKYEPSQGCCQIFTHVQSVLTSVRPYPAARLARFPDSKKHRFLDFLRHCREIGNMEFQTQENPVRVTFQFPRFFSWTLISVVEIQIYVLFRWNKISVGLINIINFRWIDPGCVAQRGVRQIHLWKVAWVTVCILLQFKSNTPKISARNNIWTIWTGVFG